MRKNLFLLTICCLFISFGFGQIKKGTIVVNTSIGNLSSFSFKNDGSAKKHHYNFNAGVGIFVKNNWEVGVGINYTRIVFDQYYIDYSQNSKSVGLNIYTNYYLGKGKLKPYFTFQTGWQHQKGWYNSFGAHQNIDNSYLYAGVGGGLNWNINSKLSLFSEVTYRKKEPFNNFKPGGLDFSVGVRFFFNKKK